MALKTGTCIGVLTLAIASVLLTATASAQLDDKENVPVDEMAPYAAFETDCPTAKGAWNASRYKQNGDLRKKRRESTPDAALG